MNAIGGPVGGVVAVLDSRLRRDAGWAERSAANLLALVIETVRDIGWKGTADSVETEQWIIGYQGHAVNGHFRDKIPVGHVVVGLVDTHAVLVDGNSLRGFPASARR